MDQGPASTATVTFFRITRKILPFGTCHFKIIARNKKAIFRENFSSLRVDAGKIFEITTFIRRLLGPHTVQLAFNMQGNEVVVFCELDTDCQEVCSQTTSGTAQQQGTNTLPDGVLLDDFLGTAAEKREAERIFREYADVFTQEGEELGCTSTMQIPPNQFEEVKQYLQELLKKGVI